MEPKKPQTYPERLLEGRRVELVERVRAGKIAEDRFYLPSSAPTRLPSRPLASVCALLASPKGTPIVLHIITMPAFASTRLIWRQISLVCARP